MAQIRILTRTALNPESSTMPKFLSSFYTGKWELFSAIKKKDSVLHEIISSPCVVT